MAAFNKSRSKRQVGEGKLEQEFFMNQGFFEATAGQNHSENKFDSNNNDSLNNNVVSESYSFSVNNNNNNVLLDENVKVRTDASSRTSAPETRAKLQDRPKMPQAKYIEHESPRLRGLSPQLTFLCTAIYSLMPPGALIGTFVLLGTFFTRFYYLALIYVIYLWVDRNTCNIGRLNFSPSGFCLSTSLIINQHFSLTNDKAEDVSILCITLSSGHILAPIFPSSCDSHPTLSLTHRKIIFSVIVHMESLHLERWPLLQQTVLALVTCFRG